MIFIGKITKHTLKCRSHTFSQACFEDFLKMLSKDNAVLFQNGVVDFNQANSEIYLK